MDKRRISYFYVMSQEIGKISKGSIFTPGMTWLVKYIIAQSIPDWCVRELTLIGVGLRASCGAAALGGGFLGRFVCLCLRSSA